MAGTVTAPTTCPGCGLELPATGLPADPRRNASPECWRLYGEVQGYELRHLQLVRNLHQLTVDTYAAQHAPRHPGGDRRPLGSPTPWSGSTWPWTAASPARRSGPPTSGWADPTPPGPACPPRRPPVP